MIPFIVIVAFLVGVVVGLIVMCVAYEIYNQLRDQNAD